MDIVLSFCIPTYNRAETTLNTIKSIIEYPGDDIEVVVVDNNSQDNTIELVSSVNDHRIRIIKNRVNIGAMGNYATSLKYGYGMYSFVVLSRDVVKTDEIPALIDFLKHNDFGVMYDGHLNKGNNIEIYKAGAEALKAIGFKDLHQTGHVYRTDYIKEIVNSFDEKACYRLYGYLPHSSWDAIISMKADAVIYNRILYDYDNKKYLVKTVSAVQEKNSNLWFSPEQRLLQMNIYAYQMSMLPITRGGFNKIYRDRYIHQLILATLTFKQFLQSDVECIHYGIKKRNVSIIEMLKEGFVFARKSLRCCDEVDKRQSLLTKLYIIVSPFGLLVYLIYSFINSRLHGR